MTTSSAREITSNLLSNYKLHIFIAGEAPREQLQFADAVFYGAGEGTIIQTAFFKDQDNTSLIAPLGSPLPFVNLIFSGPYNSSPPLYGKSRLSICGLTVAAYQNLPEHPAFEKKDTKHVFHTSDMVSVNANGIVYLHRMSHLTSSYNYIEDMLLTQFSNTIKSICIVPARDSQSLNMFIKLKSFVDHEQVDREKRHALRCIRFFNYLFSSIPSNKIISTAWTDFRTKMPYPKKIIVENIHQYLETAFNTTEIDNLCLVGCGVEEFTIIYAWIKHHMHLRISPISIVITDTSASLITSFKEFFKTNPLEDTTITFEFENISLQDLPDKLSTEVTQFDCILVLSVVQYLTASIVENFIANCPRILSARGILIFEDVQSMINRDLQIAEEMLYDALLKKDESSNADSEMNCEKLKLKFDDYKMRQTELFLNPAWVAKICKKYQLQLSLQPKQWDSTKYKERWVFARLTHQYLDISKIPQTSFETLIKKKLTHVCKIIVTDNCNLFLPIFEKLNLQPKRSLKQVFPTLFNKGARIIDATLKESQTTLEIMLTTLRQHNITPQVFLNDNNIEIIVNIPIGMFVRTSITENTLDLYNDPTFSVYWSDLVSNIFAVTRRIGMGLPPINPYFLCDIPRIQTKRDNRLLASLKNPVEVFIGVLSDTAEILRNIFSSELGLDRQFVGPDFILRRFKDDSLVEKAIINRIANELLTIHRRSQSDEIVDSPRECFNINYPLVTIAEQIDTFFSRQIDGYRSPTSKHILSSSKLKTTLAPLTTPSSDHTTKGVRPKGLSLHNSE